MLWNPFAFWTVSFLGYMGFEHRSDVDIDATELRAVAPSVGARVNIVGRGMGVIALDNEDGTWNVMFDDMAPTRRARGHSPKAPKSKKKQTKIEETNLKKNIFKNSSNKP